jgi:hypothetical protein
VSAANRGEVVLGQLVALRPALAAALLILCARAVA